MQLDKVTEPRDDYHEHYQTPMINELSIEVDPKTNMAHIKVNAVVTAASAQKILEIVLDAMGSSSSQIN